MSRTIRLSVMGAGLIGKRHIEHILADGMAVYAVANPPSSSLALFVVRLFCFFQLGFLQLGHAAVPAGVEREQH